MVITFPAGILLRIIAQLKSPLRKHVFSYPVFCRDKPAMDNSGRGLPMPRFDCIYIGAGEVCPDGFQAWEKI